MLTPSGVLRVSELNLHVYLYKLNCSDTICVECPIQLCHSPGTHDRAPRPRCPSFRDAMPRKNTKNLVLDAVIEDDREALRTSLARCRRVHATLGCEPAQLCVVDDRLECLKILHAAGASMEDAFSLAALHGRLDACKWFAFETREPFPIEFQFAEYDDPATDAWVKQITLRQGSVTLKTIPEDLLAVVDDPRVNDGARVLVGALVKKYWSRGELMTRGA